jgi:uncharacterized spore protein YtfJ
VRRKIAFSELATMTEAGACGTAVSVMPVSAFVRGEETIRLVPVDGKPSVLKTISDAMNRIARGIDKDVLGWMDEVL